MLNITFFIPAYNCSETIAESVDSIMATNFIDGDELIIVNDCSNDNTAEVLEALKEKYPVITLLNHAWNKGGAAARNKAVENAKNVLLFCLDADNVLAASSITDLKKYLTDNGADAASFQHQHYFISDKSKPEYIWTLPEGQISLQSYLHGENTPGQHGNYLFTKQSWLKAKGYAEGAGALDTWTFGLRQAITGAKMMVLKDTFYYHRLDYENSYWMRDAEANLWSASIKATNALFPFFDIIDEKFINYMLGKGRYSWFYNLKKKPLLLVRDGTKKEFYTALSQKIRDFVYPKPSIVKRAVNKLKRTIGMSK
jgi:glycosyltransferase involved in cell wall biosynthesis